MLVGYILAYVAASVAVGLYAARRVHGAADYAVAGGRFATPIAAATVFATWFGAETVLGIPATFLKEGLRGLVADPFAAVACLAIVGLVFARPLFRLDCLTLGDYFRARFGPRTETALSLAIAFSYVGWVAAHPVSSRPCYAGVVEHSVYVHDDWQGQGIGRALLEQLFASTEEAGIWTIQTGIFPENEASLALHEKCGFRVVGTQERLGKLDGVWRDVVVLERRSEVIT